MPFATRYRLHEVREIVLRGVGDRLACSCWCSRFAWICFPRQRTISRLACVMLVRVRARAFTWRSLRAARQRPSAIRSTPTSHIRSSPRARTHACSRIPTRGRRHMGDVAIVHLAPRRLRGPRHIPSYVLAFVGQPCEEGDSRGGGGGRRAIVTLARHGWLDKIKVQGMCGLALNAFRQKKQRRLDTRMLELCC